jgi:flagellar biosynthesis protein FlhB
MLCITYLVLLIRVNPCVYLYLVLCYEVIYRHLLAAFHNLSTFQQEQHISPTAHFMQHTFHQQQLIAATFIEAYLPPTASIFHEIYLVLCLFSTPSIQPS